MEADLLPPGKYGIFGAFGALIWISSCFRPPGPTATDIRADSTLIRHELALPRSDSTQFRHYFVTPVVNFQVPVVYSYRVGLMGGFYILVFWGLTSKWSRHGLRMGLPAKLWLIYSAFFEPEPLVTVPGSSLAGVRPRTDQN